MTTTHGKKTAKAKAKKATAAMSPTGGNGGSLPTATPPQQKAQTVVMVPFKGKMQPIAAGGVAMPLILALAALDDPRVNAVLTAYNVQVTNIRGEIIWPAQ